MKSGRTSIYLLKFSKCHKRLTFRFPIDILYNSCQPVEIFYIGQLDNFCQAFTFKESFIKDNRKTTHRLMGTETEKMHFYKRSYKENMQDS